MPDPARKILFVSFEVLPDVSGASTRAVQLLCHKDVEALTIKTPEHSHLERYEGIRLLRVPVTGDPFTRAQSFERAILRQLSSETYRAIVFAHPIGGYSICQRRPAARIAYAAFGFPARDMLETDPQLANRPSDLHTRKFLAQLLRRELYCLRNADAVIVGSSVARDYVLSLGVSSERVTVVLPPVDLNRFSNLPDPPTDGPFRLLYFGSFASWHGVPTLVRAMKNVSADVHLDLAGHATSGRRDLQKLLRELRLEKRVRLGPAVPHEQVPSLLARSHATVAPLLADERNTRQGAAPLKIAESLVAGRPVIASDLPVTRALLTDRVHGLLVRPGDSLELTRAIDTLAANRALCQELGAQAKEQGRQRFDGSDARRIFWEAVGL